MKLLLDTQVFIWFVSGDRSLSVRAKQAMEHAKAELYLSAASAWEMAIKIGLDKLVLPLPLDELLYNVEEGGIRMLTVNWKHSMVLQTLPNHHRDPFDRMLVAQSIVEDMTLVSGDKAMKHYKVPLIW